MKKQEYCIFQSIYNQCILQPDDNQVSIAQEPRSDLNIIARFAPCVGVIEGNCLSGIEIQYRSVVVKMTGKTLTINSMDYSDTIDKTPYYSKHLFVKQATSRFRMVRGFGFKVLYDTNKLLYITLDPFYAHKVSDLMISSILLANETVLKVYIVLVSQCLSMCLLDNIVSVLFLPLTMMIHVLDKYVSIA